MKLAAILPISVLLLSVLTAFSQSAFGKDETDRSNTLGALKINPIHIDKKPLKPSIDKTIESYRDLHELLKGIEKNGFATDGGIPPAMLNNIRSEVGRRLFDLELEENEKLQFFSDTDGDNQAKLNTKAQKFYRSTAKIYENILLENPSYKSNDRVLYQLAHIYDLMGETKKMLSALTKLANKYKKSDFYVESHFRLAERYFVTKDYENAATHYGIVFRKGKSTSFFDQTVYKYGWTLFKLQEVGEAMQHFILLLDRLLMGAADTKLVDKSSKKSLFYDVLHIVGYTFAHMGGHQGVNRYFEEKGHRAYEYLIYKSLGEHYESKGRIDDSAKTYLAFVSLYPAHRRAAELQIKAIDAYVKGGFPTIATKEKEAFVERYKFSTPLWENLHEEGKAWLKPHLKKHLADLSQHYHAMAQQGQNKKPPSAQAGKDFNRALYWYQLYLSSFSDAANSGDITFMMAELLFDFKHYSAAADNYLIAAYEKPAHDRSAEAGYGALMAYAEEMKQLADKQKRSAWQALEIKSALRFSETFPTDPRRAEVLTKVSEQLFHSRQYEHAEQIAQQVITLKLATDDRMLLTVKRVFAHASFELYKFAQAENAYLELLRLLPEEDAQHQKTVERLAAAIYKQGEMSRTPGNHYKAAQHFQRVSRLAPSSSIKETADYDAANSFLEAGAWAEASAALDIYLQRYPNSPALDEIRKKQVLAYLEDGKQIEAAGIYTVIAQFDQSDKTRLEASWNAAEIYTNLNQSERAISALKSHIKQFPEPLEQAIEARQKIADIYEERANIKKRDFWLKQIIKIEKKATGSQTERIHFLAAKASFILADPLFKSFIHVKLKIPLKKSLRSKKQKMKAALNAYKNVAKYQVARFTTAATYHTAEIHRQLGQALMGSERPKGLNEEELEQYDILLEDQAYPFEERAIKTHQANTETVLQGIYNRWNRLSFAALAKLQPVRYDKQEKSETIIHALQ